jgi:hypothetical protein
MILLDTALPPSTPWWVAALAAITASPGVAAVVIAWLQSRAKKADAPDLKPLTERVAAAEEKIAAVVGTDRADVAKLKDDLGALAADVEALRNAVERRWVADDKRRGRAGELAQQDRKELHDALATLRERVAGMAGRLEGMMERSHGRQ